MKQMKQIQDLGAANLLIDTEGSIRMGDEAHQLIDDIGTEREWVAVGHPSDDKETPGEIGDIVLLCHPSNAPLFASAPDLLNMLERVMSEYLMSDPVGGPIALLTLEHARAAIAKARGQA